MYNVIMDTKRDLIQELFLALLIWGDDKTCYNLCKLMWRGFNKEYVASNMFYKTEQFKRFMLEKESKKMLPDGVSRILSIILYITTELCKLHDITEEFDKKYIKQVEELIEQAANNNCIVYWKPDKFCEQLNVFIYSHKIYKKHNSEIILSQNGQKVKLIVDGNENTVNGITNITKNPTLHRFLKMQNAITETYKKSLDTYCPWCNPKITLKKSKRQRKCISCQKIEKFIYPDNKKAQNEVQKRRKAFNMSFTRLRDKGNNINETIKLRGKELLKIVESMQTDKCKDLQSNELIECINLIKDRYNI